jgi:TRAP-type C4-dicarboxylate transport system permease small subunit
MNELMIIVFGLAVVRTLTPLIKKENWNFGSLLLAISMCWAFYHLLFNCATITFNGL